MSLDPFNQQSQPRVLLLALQLVPLQRPQTPPSLHRPQAERVDPIRLVEVIVSQSQMHNLKKYPTSLQGK